MEFNNIARVAISSTVDPVVEINYRNGSYNAIYIDTQSHKFVGSGATILIALLDLDNELKGE